MTEPNFESMRDAMVSNQLRTNAVTDPAVVAAMGKVARENFVPAVRADVAYTDIPVALANKRALNAPIATARLLNALEIRRGEKVLVIGAATGYAAALVAELGAVVVALEEDSALVDAARAALAGHAGLTVVSGALAQGWAADAPYDVILIDGAVPQVPDAIRDQLREGGRIATGIVERGVMRLAVGRRVGNVLALAAFVDTETVILPGFEVPAGFAF